MDPEAVKAEAPYHGDGEGDGDGEGEGYGNEGEETSALLQPTITEHVPVIIKPTFFSVRWRLSVALVVLTVASAHLWLAISSPLHDALARWTSPREQLLEDAGSYQPPAPWLDGSLNPLFRTTDLVEDGRLHLASVNDVSHDASPRTISIKAGETNTLAFACTPDLKFARCPDAFRVWVVGPTAVSPPNSNSSRGAIEQQIEVQLSVADPGIYRIYAWPLYDDCQPIEDQQLHYHRMVASGFPLEVEVTGDPLKDGYGECNPDTNHAGRWVAKNAISAKHYNADSPHAWWLVPRSDFAFVYAPFDCKLAWKNAREWLDDLKPPHFLSFGDSTLRGPFCGRIWPFINNGSSQICHWSDHSHYHDDRRLTVQREDGHSSDVSWLWLPTGNLEDQLKLQTFLRSASTNVSHVMFSIGYWDLPLNAQTTALYFRQMLNILWEEIPNAVIAVKEISSTVEAIHCFADAMQQRRFIEPANVALLQHVAWAQARGQKVFSLPHYQVTDSMPSSSADGRHWQETGVGQLEQRGDVGITEVETLNQMWSRFHQYY